MTWSTELLNGDSNSCITHRQLGWYDEEMVSSNSKVMNWKTCVVRWTNMVSQALIHLVSTLWGTVLRVSG